MSPFRFVGVDRWADTALFVKHRNLDATRAQPATPAATIHAMQQVPWRALNDSRFASCVALFMALWMAFLSSASIGARYGDSAAGLVASSQGALCTLGLADKSGENSPQTLLCPLCATASAPPPADRVALLVQSPKSNAPVRAHGNRPHTSPATLLPPVRAPPPFPVIS